MRRALLIAATFTSVVLMVMRLRAYWVRARTPLAVLYVEHVLAPEALADRTPETQAESRQKLASARRLAKLVAQLDHPRHIEPSPWLKAAVSQQCTVMVQALFKAIKAKLPEWKDTGPDGIGQHLVIQQLKDAIDKEAAHRARLQPSALKGSDGAEGSGGGTEGSGGGGKGSAEAKAGKQFEAAVNSLLKAKDQALLETDGVLGKVEHLNKCVEALTPLKPHQHPPRALCGDVLQRVWDAAFLLQLYLLCCVPLDEHPALKAKLVLGVLYMMDKWLPLDSDGDEYCLQSAAYLTCRSMRLSGLRAGYRDGLGACQALLRGKKLESAKCAAILKFLLLPEESIRGMIEEKSPTTGDCTFISVPNCKLTLCTVLAVHAMPRSLLDRTGYLVVSFSTWATQGPK